MVWKIIWSEPALETFQQAHQYLMEIDPVVAESMRVGVLDHVEALARFPFIGPRYEPDQSGRVREIICKPYRIFYRLQEAEKTVEVLTVWHSSRQEPELPTE